MDFAVVLAADELWGWPVDVLDRLVELRQRAWAGEISIEAWRDQDAALRVGHPEVDTKEVEEFRLDWLMNGPRDTSEDAYDRLTGRLSALADSAPTDEELWEELSALHEALADSQLDRRVEEIRRNNRDRIRAWLTRPGSGIDPVTGLFWSWIVRYRVVNDPDLGQIPQYVDVARKLAVEDAPAADCKRAEMIVSDKTSSERKLAASMDAVRQHQLAWLPGLVMRAASDNEALRSSAASLAAVWCDPEVQQLLLRETSRGWPAPFDDGSA